MIQLKEKVREFIYQEIEKRISAAEKAVKAAQDSANGESKSSAGDKYETGRAMAQNDRDMYALQLNQALADKQFLDHISFDQPCETVRNGALAETSLGWFMLAVSLGAVVMDGTRIMVISARSPIGMALNGRSEGQTFEFRGQACRVISIQ